MDTRSGAAVTLRMFLGITVIGFIAWVVGLSAIALLLIRFGINVDLFVMIEALSLALASAAAFGAGFIAYRELSEVASSRHMDIADRLFDELNSAENIEARRRVYRHLSPYALRGRKTLSAGDQDAIKTVLNSLDRVAFLTQSGWIPDDVIMPWMHPMIAKSWEKLESYVLHERERRNEPYYYRYVGELAARCRKWRTDHAVDVSVKWIDSAL